MEWEEFHDNVIGWSRDRGILDNGSVIGQAGKFLEEAKETWDAMNAKNKAEIKDGIGDVAVTLININALAGGDSISNNFLDEYSHGLNPFTLLGMVISGVMIDPSRIRPQQSLSLLREVAENLGYDFMECCELAWNEIKDRKGYLDKQGVFHKEVTK